MAISKAIMEIVPVLQNGYKLETNRLVKDGYIQKMLNEKEEIVVSPAVVSFIGGFDGVKCFSELLSHNQGRKLDYSDAAVLLAKANDAAVGKRMLDHQRRHFGEFDIQLQKCVGQGFQAFEAGFCRSFHSIPPI